MREHRTKILKNIVKQLKVPNVSFKVKRSRAYINYILPAVTIWPKDKFPKSIGEITINDKEIIVDAKIKIVSNGVETVVSGQTPFKFPLHDPDCLGRVELTLMVVAQAFENNLKHYAEDIK